MNCNSLRTAALLAAVTPLAVGAPTAHSQVEKRVERTAALESNDPRADELERALAAITVGKCASDIEFIASDELEGRDSPSKGLRIAARFIRARLQRLGFTPGAPEESFFWEYELTQHVVDPGASFAALTLDNEVHRLEFGRDYFLSSGHHRDATGAVVYGGGFGDEEVKDLDLSGKWVLLDPGTRVSRRSSGTAARMGVAGFLVPADPDAEQSVAEAFSARARYMLQPSLRASRGGRAPSVHLTEAWSAKLPTEGLKVGAGIDATFQEVWHVDSNPAILENVCGIWPGSDPKLRNEVIILSAHYDHVGMQGGELHNGADDNGSGTTGLLAIGEALKAYGPMRRTVLLMWVSAEEKGLIGSREWTEDPWLPEGMRPLCNINIDMIGRNAPNEIGITPTKERPEYNRMTQLVEEHMGSEGFTKLNSADDYWNRSDHANFSRNLKIPVAFLFSDIHEDYHKPTDDPHKIDVDKLHRVARLVVRLLHDLQADELEF